MTRSASRNPDWVGLSEASRVLGVSPARSPLGLARLVGAGDDRQAEDDLRRERQAA